ncbi:MAG: RsmB/NOP family class I SAM-dependent RNA methyltransferase [Alphaproteobacteria bacterium]|nr:RsmB/NOP family class I SAM-dependent RNA methyltransferase [Alphaproteobacteria bacterium]MBF0251296.1 RsmB/NOP family class I SAM-dependent RNA methyltransferase [Alphaproteobacteria bacterium]
MTPAGRLEAAIYLLDKIADERRPADDIVRAWFQARRFVGSQDRRAIRERVYGVLRRLHRLDWHLGDTPPTARNRVLADVVLEGQDPSPLFDGSTHAPAPLTAEERMLAERLAGKSLDDATLPTAVRAELPEWLADMLAPVFGDDFQAEMQALNAPAPMDLRVALGRVSRDQAQKALAKERVPSTITPLSPLGLRLDAHTDIGRTQTFRKGLVEVQDEGSQILALLVGARADMAVMDYCAGAGGKTLAIADRMGLTDGHSTGRLVACDVDGTRLARMDRRLARARLTERVERLVLDEAAFGERESTFQRVLVDAPCSGSGTWRRHPEQKRRLTQERLAELTATQDQVLTDAARFVAPGGRLIYATCSVLREENEQRVESFLKSHEHFDVTPIQGVWAETMKKTPCPDFGAAPFLRLTPRRHGTDGFFAAILTRRS